MSGHTRTPRSCPGCGSGRLMVLDDGAICPDCKKLYMVRNPTVERQAVAVREFQERREKAYAALLAAVEEILPCCIDEWGRDDPDVEALIKAVAAAKGTRKE